MNERSVTRAQHLPDTERHASRHRTRLCMHMLGAVVVSWQVWKHGLQLVLVVSAVPA